MGSMVADSALRAVRRVDRGIAKASVVPCFIAQVRVKTWDGQGDTSPLEEGRGERRFQRCVLALMGRLQSPGAGSLQPVSAIAATGERAGGAGMAGRPGTGRRGVGMPVDGRGPLVGPGRGAGFGSWKDAGPPDRAVATIGNRPICDRSTVAPVVTAISAATASHRE